MEIAEKITAFMNNGSIKGRLVIVYTVIKSDQQHKLEAEHKFHLPREICLQEKQCLLIFGKCEFY